MTFAQLLALLVALPRASLRSSFLQSFVVWGALAWAAAPETAARQVELAPLETPRGFIARLLINETPFPGEPSWLSEEDTGAAQAAIVCVLRNRLRNIPRGYVQRQVAAVTTDDIVKLIAAGGVHGQVEGFYLDPAGRPAVSEHVSARIDFLLAVANRGAPGRFARLIRHAQDLADQVAGERPADPFAELREMNSIRVTGFAFGWMTDRSIYRIGGNFVRIGDRWRGSLGGNRFFTLRRLR